MPSGIVLDLRNLGDLSDNSRYHHSLTNTNGIVVRGIHGSGINFNGTNAFIDIGDINNEVKTVALWCKPSSIGMTEEILDLNGTAYIKATTGTITAEGFNTPTIYVNGLSSSTITTNWNYVVATSDTPINASDVDIGRLEASTWFNGIISSTTFWNYPLFTDEIKRYYLSKGYLREPHPVRIP